MHKKDLLFLVASILIILIILLFSVFQIKKGHCLKEKEVFIKSNLPDVYGPEVTIEERIIDNKKINDVYNNCVYSWKLPF